MGDDKKPVNISGDATPVFEGLKTNLEAAPKGLKKLFTAFFGERYAKNAYYQVMTAAQAQVDYNKVLSGEAEFRDGELVPLSSLTDTTHVPSLRAFQEQQENENLVACMGEALKDVADKHAQGIEADNEPLDGQFFSRWRAEAVHMSDEYMRQLWGKILSEEVHTKRSFSLRTLDILRNMDAESGELFEHLCSYVVGRKIVFLGEKKKKFTGRHPAQEIEHLIRSVGTFENLVGLGLLFPLRVWRPLPNGEKLFITYGHSCVKTSPYFGIDFLVYDLSPSGEELYRMVNKEITEENIHELCRIIAKSDKSSGAVIEYNMRHRRNKEDWRTYRLEDDPVEIKFRKKIEEHERKKNKTP